MLRRARLALVALVVTGAALPWSPPVSGAAVRAGSVSGWVPYWETSGGVAAIESAGSTMTEVMPFWFTARDAATIQQVASGNLTSVVNAARARGMLVIPSVTDGTGRLVMQSILLDPSTRATHVNALVTLAVTRGFDGIDLDYEGFAFTDGRSTWDTTRPAWLAFVQELAGALHANGKLLSVTVPPMWDDGRSGYSVYFPSAPADWSSLVGVVDRLRLMVYDWSVGSPGPIAPMSWVRNVIAYVHKQVPAPEQRARVWLGVPAYGRIWARVSGECPAGVSLATTTLQSADAADRAATHGAAITDVRHANGSLEHEKTFSWVQGTYTGPKTVVQPPAPYVPPQQVAGTVGPADQTGLAPAVRLQPTTVDVTCTVTRVAYVPDESSIVERARVAESAGLGGIVIWALGYEPRSLWPMLAAA